MSAPLVFPACPWLPALEPGLDCAVLSAHGPARGAAFYLSCLDYAQTLWCRGLPARALLCLDRAMGAALSGGEAELVRHPMPYRAVAWILHNSPGGVFIGNPRVHFQHYADRMNEPRREQRAWRAWACWALARTRRPAWPGDARHHVREPSPEEIAGALRRVGLPGEAELWMTVLADYEVLAKIGKNSGISEETTLDSSPLG